jgi:hypothetical protein
MRLSDRPRRSKGPATERSERKKACATSIAMIFSKVHPQMYQYYSLIQYQDSYILKVMKRGLDNK